MERLKGKGLGVELQKQAIDNGVVVGVKYFAQSKHVHSYGREIVEKLVEDFGKVEVVKQYSDYFK